MNTLVIHNLEIDLLIDLLSNRCADILSKVWRGDDLVSGVFILEDAESRELGVSITTILEHKSKENSCTVVFHAARVCDENATALAAEAQLRNTLVEFAEENDWRWE
ncbi:MAG: hypothetical protein ACFFED_05640 [Candidatus Thorarchaeota archaeon]